MSALKALIFVIARRHPLPVMQRGFMPRRHLRTKCGKNNVIAHSAQVRMISDLPLCSLPASGEPEGLTYILIKKNLHCVSSSEASDA